MIKKEQIVKNSEVDTNDADETVISMSDVSSTGSVNLVKANHPSTDNDLDASATNSNQTSRKKRNSFVAETYKKVKQRIKLNKNTDANKTKRKLISFSVLKDIRFITFCIATFVFILPTTGVFLPALAKTRGLSDMQTAHLLTIIAGCETAIKVVAGFTLDFKPIRHLRPLIFNAVSFLQCIVLFCFPLPNTFGQYAVLCCVDGAFSGLKEAQGSVILVDILGVDKLSSSFAILLATQGIGTLVGPPISGFLKDTYGKYDYIFYFGGNMEFLGSLILAGGNIRHYCVQKKARRTKETGTE